MKNRLLQLFKDNRNISASIKAEKNGEEATMYLYDAIGGWFGVEAKDFVQDLNALEADTVHLRINSPGGDVFDGRAIATALKQCKAKTIAHIDGVCASAATYIALACDEVKMAEGAFFMIHQAWTFAIGNAEDLLATAALLEKVDASIVNDYAKKTGIDAAELKSMMAAETWLNAEEATEKGFVDEVYDGEDVDMSWNLSAYDNAPEMPKAQAADDFDRERFERRLTLLEATM